MNEQYPFLDFYADIARRYPELPDGTYVSDDGKYTIIKKRITHMGVEEKTPTRVGYGSGKIEINNNLDDYSFSGRLLFLVWGAAKYQGCLDKGIKFTDLDADEKTLEILSDYPRFNKPDALIDFIKGIRPHELERNVKRVEFMTNTIKG